MLSALINYHKTFVYLKNYQQYLQNEKLKNNEILWNLLNLISKDLK